MSYQPTEVQATRRQNILDLIGPKHGAIRDFVRTYGLSEQLIYQIKHHKRNVGDNFARKVEAAKGLPIGWLDQKHEPDPDLFNDQLLAAARLRAIPFEMRTTILYLISQAPRASQVSPDE